MLSTLPILTEQFQREKIDELLAQCTPKQQELFKRCFPGGIKEYQLGDAYALCERTVRQNKREAKTGN